MMPLQMPEKELNKLIAILGKLGSEYENERDAAGIKAHQIVSKYGTWELLLKGSIPVQQQQFSRKNKKSNIVRPKRTANYAYAIKWIIDALTENKKVITTCIHVIAKLFGRTFNEVCEDIHEGKPLPSKPGAKRRKIPCYRDALTLISQINESKDLLIDFASIVFYRSIDEVKKDLYV